jgi:malate synthase
LKEAFVTTFATGLGRRDIELLAPDPTGTLDPSTLAFVADLSARFGGEVQALLERRRQVQARIDAGARPGFSPETAAVRESDWTVGEMPEDLRDRRVEITGPVDRKMVINGLNSGARVFMADFEDATAPTWANVVQGQANLCEAVRGTIRYVQPSNGKVYALADDPATLMVRPRGWHLSETHVRLSGQPVPAALFDFGVFFHKNALALLERGSGPYFYLPKMQGHREARLWNDVFLFAQDALGLARGTIKATVLVETLPAAFEMDEILFELREHSVGLNCGRWDYIFSFIKTLRADPAAVLPDRGQVTMEQPFLRAYTQLLVKTCHRRGAHAMGGMAAQIPIKDDPQKNAEALARVRADKLREARDGHDGTWVAHPGLVPLAREVFDAHMPGSNQVHRQRPDVFESAAIMLRTPEGTRTEAGLRHNVRVGLAYLESWLGGVGCVPIDNLMEDAATAEICRTQLWQWMRHGATLEDGRIVTPEIVSGALADEMCAQRSRLGASAFAATRYQDAAKLFESLCRERELPDFLTLAAYDTLVS